MPTSRKDTMVEDIVNSKHREFKPVGIIATYQHLHGWNTSRQIANATHYYDTHYFVGEEGSEKMQLNGMEL